MRQFLRNKFSNMDFTSLSASTLWNYFNTVLQEAIRLFVPVSTKQSRHSKPLWMTGKVVRSVKKKHRLWLKWRHHHDENDLESFFIFFAIFFSNSFFASFTALLALFACLLYFNKSFSS